MPGKRGASQVPKNFMWICRRQLSGLGAQASCCGRASIYPFIASIDTFIHYTWMSPRSMATVTEIHALARGGATQWTSGAPDWDPGSTCKSLQGVVPIAVKSHLTRYSGTSNSVTSLVPSLVNDRGTGAIVPGCKSSFPMQLSSESAGIHTSWNMVIRQYQGSSMESVARTVGACWNSRRSSNFSKNGCSSPSNDSLFGSPTRNNYRCSRVMKDSGMRSHGSISGDSEFAENIAAAPVIRQKAAVKKGSVPVRFINPGAIPDMRLIHETAVVHADALLGEGVEIGPFCTVGPHVKLGNGCKLRSSCHIFGETQLGDNCVILSGAVVGADIPGHTIIGDNTTIGHYAVVGVKCQDMKYKDGDECYLYVGNNNDIREFASVHRSSKPDDTTVVGNDNLIMGSCHVAHDCKIGNGNILSNGTLLGGHVVVEDLVHTGGGVAVHQFCHVGSYAFLAGGSMVDRDVPMYMMVAGDRAELRGLNLEGMRRCGFSDLEIRRVRKAYQKLFMNSRNSGGMEERLLETEQDEDLVGEAAVTLMLQSVRDCYGEKRRGICKFKLWASVR